MKSSAFRNVLAFGAFTLSGLVPSALAQIYNSGNGHYYSKIEVPTGISWPDAKAAAAAMSYAGVPGHLITITSADEQAFLTANFTDLHGYWFGGYQDTTAPDYSEPGGGWRWVTGEPWNYTNWNSGEPNNNTSYKGLNANEDALAGWTSDGKWNDAAHILVDSYDSRGYIVEFDTNLPPGILYYGANGHYYQKVNAPNGISWNDANSAAAAMTFQNLTGHLVTITDAGEQAFLSSNMGNLRGYWYGGYQDTTAPDYVEPAGGWRWITGEPWNYTNWNSGEPNNDVSYNGLGLNEDRLVGWSADGHWNDLAGVVVRAADSQGYIVEYESLTPNISGSVSLEGVGDLSAIYSAIPIRLTVEFFAGGSSAHTTPLFSKSATVTAVGANSPAGTYTVSGITPGIYDIGVKSSINLRKIVTNALLSGSAPNIPPVFLPAGDANNDNSVDSTDFGILIGAFGSDVTIPGSGYDPTADFNGDGVVDSSDFGLLIGNFNTVGAP